jgi:hypothetical protein
MPTGQETYMDDVSTFSNNWTGYQPVVILEGLTAVVTSIFIIIIYVDFCQNMQIIPEYVIDHGPNILKETFGAANVWMYLYMAFGFWHLVEMAFVVYSITSKFREDTPSRALEQKDCLMTIGVDCAFRVTITALFAALMGQACAYTVDMIPHVYNHTVVESVEMHGHMVARSGADLFMRVQIPVMVLMVGMLHRAVSNIMCVTKSVRM